MKINPGKKKFEYIKKLCIKTDLGNYSVAK